MRKFLVVILIFNVLAVGYAYFVPSALSAIGVVNAMSEMAELEHASAIDAAKLSEYNRTRYPTTVAAEDAIRSGDLTSSIYEPLRSALRQSSRLTILLGMANAMIAGFSLAIAFRRQPKRAQTDG